MDKNLIKSLSLEQIRNLSTNIKKQKDLYGDNLIKTNKKKGPLSFAQQRMLFLNEFCPFYHALPIAHIKSQFKYDLDLLKKSFNLIIERHDIFRTVFDLKSNLQIVQPKLEIDIRYIDLQNVDSPHKEAKKIILQQNNITFDLEKGPLLRFSALQLGEKEYIFVIIIHHIISDGWTNNLLFKELAYNYKSLTENIDFKLPENEFQYLDYVYWEKNRYNQFGLYNKDESIIDGFNKKSQSIHNKEKIGIGTKHIITEKKSQIQNIPLTQALEYWKNKLKGELNPPLLHTDYKRPSIASYSGSMEFEKLSADFTNKIRAFCLKEKISIYELMFSIFFILIYTYTKQEDLIIGTAMVNRNKRQFQDIFGLFTNTVLFRILIEDNTTIIRLIKMVSEINKKALDFQELPFDRLIQELQPQRKLSNTSLISVFFSYQNFLGMFDHSQIETSPFNADTGVSFFEFELIAQEVNDFINLTINYSKDIFDAKTIKYMLSCYKEILQNLIENENFLHSEISKICISQQKATPCTLKKPLYINFIEQFENQAKINSKKIAIRSDSKPSMDGFVTKATSTINNEEQAFKVDPKSFAEETLTYHELNSRANQLAIHLKKLGIKPEDRIGIHMHRSASAIISLLAILKIGGTYVPLDMDLPLFRINYILKDANISFVLCFGDHDYGNISKINLADFKFSEKTFDNLNIDIKQNSLAYIIYTSGTTGKPKGVCIENRNLSSYINAIQNDISSSLISKTATSSDLDLLKPAYINENNPEFDKIDSHNKRGNSPNFDLEITKLSFGMISPLSTDLGNTIIFTPLYYGATIDIISKELLYDFDKLATKLKQNPIDCLKITPTHGKMFLESNHIKDLLPKKLLIFAGEPLEKKLIEDIRKYSDCKIKNNYGPTETTISILSYNVPKSIDNSLYVPLGYELANSKVYILNKNMDYVPNGAIGELYIGGDGVGKGYLNLADLTSKRFIVRKNERLYKTGDLVRRRANGSIEFLGRIDRQVKLNGYRVELGEIESIMEEHPEIKQAVAIKTEDGIIVYSQCYDDSKDNILGVYQDVSKTDFFHKEKTDYQNSFKQKQYIKTDRLEMLKEFLMNRIPSFITIKSIIILNDFPIMSNGKIDYKKLSDHDFISKFIEYPRIDNLKTYPRDEIELELTKIWEEILEVESISINDSFFDLGGHSLLAMRLVNKIEECFNKRIALSFLFENNTIEKLSNIIRNMNKDSDSTISLSDKNHKNSNLIDPREHSIIELSHNPKPKKQIFFVHPSGGNIFCYYQLAKLTNSDYQFNGIQYTFLDNNELGKDIKTMADFYLEKVMNKWDQSVPLVFGGWSLGAAIAYEMAYQFAQKNINNIKIDNHDKLSTNLSKDKLPLVVMLDYEIREKKKKIIIEDALNHMIDFICKIELLTGVKSELSFQKLKDKNEEQQIQIVLDYFKYIKYVPKNLKTEELKAFFNMQRIHNIANANFKPKSYHGDVLIIKAQDLLFLNNNDIVKKRDKVDNYLGWNLYLTKKPCIKTVEGNHITMMAPEKVENIANSINEWLEIN
ncbi:MAG: AMP-binding protein [Bacteroidetes bacterium]|nr:AMP-binding protein [Bacteroidota bacterium]